LNELLPEDVTKKTLDLAGGFDILRLILSSALYTMAAILLFILFGQPLEWVHYVLIFVLMATYSLFRAAIIRSRVKNALIAQSNYLLKAHPNADLYIPMLEKPFGVIRLKKAALFRENDQLWLEAFDLQITQIHPKKSLSVPLGPDFSLQSITPGERPDYVRVMAKIKEQNYPFVIPAIERIVALLDTYLSIEKKEVI
jgi:hypothetical protein